MFTRQSRRGANAIEFALTAPVFFVLIMTLVDYGWWFAAQAGLNNAAVGSCREGSMIDSRLGNPLAVARAELATRAAPWCAERDCTYDVVYQWAFPDRAVRCTVSMPYTPLVGLVPTPTQVSATTRYRLEWQR